MSDSAHLADPTLIITASVTVALVVLVAVIVLLVMLVVSLHRQRRAAATTAARLQRTEARDAAKAAHLRRLSEILEATPDLVAVVDADGRFDYLNTAARHLYQIESDEQLSTLRGLDAYTPATKALFLRDVIPTAERDGVWRGEVTLALPGGSELPASTVLVAHRHSDGSIDYYSSITRDLSERKAIEAQLEHVGLHDALTGLPNRVLFIDRLAQGLSRASRLDTHVAVLTLDIDQFKLVNDSYGHDAGDTMLMRAAHRLVESVRPGDTVARFGADTFGVLCEDLAGEDEAVELAQRLSASLAAPFDVNDDRVFLTVSVGIAVTGDGPATAETMLRDADAAMHRAKEKGRARYEVFVEDVRSTAVHRLRTANDLHRALTETEFRLVYQPEVSLTDGHIRAVEALVRWHHPDRGLVPPVEFVPLAEETGLIEGIGSWVLETALEQAARWRGCRYDGSSLPIWVNLSARQLSGADIVEQIADALARHQVESYQLGLEITETALLEDGEDAVAVLAALRGLGVRLAVDDFGTGYSSLAYLKRLPVDAVKIDRSFVDGLAVDQDDSAIVAAVTGMAGALRLSTIAEGVETMEQVRALQRLGCELGQGYFFTTPQPPANITRLLESDQTGALFPIDGLDPLPGQRRTAGVSRPATA